MRERYRRPMDADETSETVHFEIDGPVCLITIDRPHARNAVDGPTQRALSDAFRRFDADDALSVAILTGAGGTFCAGADLKAVASKRGNRVETDMTRDGPMGPTRMVFGKPVIAAVEGHAVAGGLELAVMCDLRVAADDAVFGIYCRRWGVPLIDGGTIRLPRLIGQSHALDMILTGRGVSGEEARMMGLANRLTPKGEALAVAASSPIRSPPSRKGACAPIGARASSNGICRSPKRSPTRRARARGHPQRRDRRRCGALRIGRRTPRPVLSHAAQAATATLPDPKQVNELATAQRLRSSSPNQCWRAAATASPNG